MLSNHSDTWFFLFTSTFAPLKSEVQINFPPLGQQETMPIFANPPVLWWEMELLWKGPFVWPCLLLSRKPTFPRVLFMLIILFLPLSSSRFWPQKQSNKCGQLHFESSRPSLRLSVRSSPLFPCHCASFLSSLLSWTSSLAAPKWPWNSCWTKWDNYRSSFENLCSVKSLGELPPRLKPKANPKGS